MESDCAISMVPSPEPKCPKRQIVLSILSVFVSFDFDGWIQASNPVLIRTYAYHLDKEASHTIAVVVDEIAVVTSVAKVNLVVVEVIHKLDSLLLSVEGHPVFRLVAVHLVYLLVVVHVV